MLRTFKIICLIYLLIFTSCSSGTGIFPIIVLSTSEDKVQMPNPISIIVDTANSQIVVANSNVDILFNKGSIAVLSFDASNTSAPTLTAEKLIEAPNFAVEMFFDGASTIYAPFRETSETDESMDTFIKYTIAASDITVAQTKTVADNPFGITGDATQIYVVSDRVLGIYDTSLNLIASVDLTTADTAGIDDSNANNVLDVAIDTTNNLAVVSNTGGRMFIVDLSTNTLVQAVDGPTNTRNLVIDSRDPDLDCDDDNADEDCRDLLYVLDGVTEAVWVFDMNALPSPSSTPESVDDSKFLLTTMSVGNDPNGIALDETNNRLYVGNSADDTISVLDTLTFQEIDRISLDQDDISTAFLRDGEDPIGLALGTFNSVTYLFVACFSSHDVLVINTKTLNVVNVFPNREF